MRIAKDCIVSLQFTLTNDTGQVLDRSPPDQPLQYLHGAAGILPALERALAGKAAGESFDVTLPPEQAFGDRQPRLIEVLPRGDWTNSHQMAVGLQVERRDEAGQKVMYVIKALDADTVTLDANHPLAGQTLRFQGTVLDVRAATADELG
jgi:FKBP-type peptidyl-prolyl cis-trans isomerase SlyD